MLGVVAGLELADRLDVPLAVVAFRDEERGCAGSSWCAAAGQLPEAYLELHVEQGPVLERANEPIGIVTAVAGIARGEVVFEGRADHAGTTPMDARDDALLRAAEYVLHVSRAPWPGTVATVGRMHVEPGAVNVVPSRVTLSVEARAANRPDLDRLVAEIGFEPIYLAEPAAMSGPPFEALKAAAPDAPELVSGAGPRRGDPRRRRRPDRDGLRPQPERRHQPLAGGAVEPRGHLPRDRRARRRTG